MRREVAIVGIADFAAASRRVLEGSREIVNGEEALENLAVRCGRAAQSALIKRNANESDLLESIRSIEEGRAEIALISDDAGAIALRERVSARNHGDSCYAVLSAGEARHPNVEFFDVASATCEAIQTASLSLFYRFLPASSYRASRRPWFATGDRRAVIRGARGERFTLTEPRVSTHPPITTFQVRSLQLILISADSIDELESEIASIRADAQDGRSLQDIARVARMRCLRRKDRRFGLGLLCRTGDDLLCETDLLTQGIGRALRSGEEWKTPAGSCFAPNPLGAEGVAFVYPGVGSPYAGAGADLFGIAPHLIDRFEQLSGGHGARYLHLEELYPRHSVTRSSFKLADVVASGECAISLSCVWTMLIRDVFGVAPQSAFGYSFGEAIMPAALGIWPSPVTLTDRLDTSPTFRSRLQGNLLAIRDFWNATDSASIDWRSFTVRATPAEAYQALRPENRAYLCMINSPEQVVIAGDAGACERVLGRLRSAVLPMPIAVTMHSPPALSERDEFIRIHDLETLNLSRPEMYFSATYDAVPAERVPIARAIAEGYTKMVDFPRLVRRVYADGARIFIEVGSRRNCTSWIEKTLHGRPHVAIPCDSQGLSGEAAVLRLLARLFAHRVSFELDSLAGDL